MKIVVNRKEFLDALTIGGSMSSKAKGLSILECAKITLKDGKATISSYDSEVAITKRTPIVDYQEECTFCVNPKELGSVLKSLRDERVTIDLNEEKYICSVIHEKGEMSLPYDSADDFPSPVLDKDMAKQSVSSEILYNWLREAKLFADTNTLHPQLMGVNVFFENGTFGVVSTDTSVMYCNSTAYEYEGEKLDATISVRAIDALLPMINETENVTIMIGERNIVFRTDNSMLIATKSDLQFPNYKAVIPTSHNIEVEIEKGELLDAINRAMLMTNKKTTMLKFKFNSMSCEIQGEDFIESKKSFEQCLCTCMGGQLELAMKGSYLLDMLSVIESEKVVIHLIDFNRQIILKDLSNESKLLLMMPFLS